MSTSSCQRIVVRNLPHDVSEIEFLTYLSQRKSCAALFESDSAPQAVLSSFKPGKAPNPLKGRAAVSASAFLMVESPSQAQLVAAALDSIAFRPTTDPQLLMTVEYSPSQEPPTPGTVRLGSGHGVTAPESIFLDSDYTDFLIKHNLTNNGADARGATTVEKDVSSQPSVGASAPSPATTLGGTSMSKGHTTAILEKWMEDQKLEAESRRSTALVQAMLGKWYRNIPFSWEQRRSGGGKTDDCSSNLATGNRDKKMKERQKEIGEATAAAVPAVNSSSSKKSRSEARSKKGDGKQSTVHGKHKAVTKKEKHEAKRNEKDGRSAPSQPGPLGTPTQDPHNKEKKRKKNKNRPHDEVEEEKKARRQRTKQREPRTTGVAISGAHEEQPRQLDPGESQRRDARRKKAKPQSMNTGAPEVSCADEPNKSRRKKDRATRTDTGSHRADASLAPQDCANTGASQRPAEQRKRGSKTGGKNKEPSPPSNTTVELDGDPAKRARRQESNSKRKKTRQEEAPSSVDVEQTGGKARRHLPPPPPPADSGPRGGGSYQGDVGVPVAGDAGRHANSGKSREQEILDALATREQKKQRAKEKEVRARRQEQVVREANEQLRRREDPSETNRSSATVVAESVAATPASKPTQPSSSGPQQRNKFSVSSTTQRSNASKSAGTGQHRDPAGVSCDDATPIPAPRRMIVMRRGGEATAGGSTASSQQQLTE